MNQAIQAQHDATNQLAVWTKQNQASLITSGITAGGGIISSWIQSSTAKKVAEIQKNTAIDVALINQETALKSLAAQVKMHQDGLESQEMIARLQRELQAFSTEYQQCREDQRLANRLHHEEWVTYFQRETQRLMAWENLRVAKATTDDDEIRQGYPLKTPQRVLLDDYFGYYKTRDRIPPLVVLSPVALEFEPFPLPHASQGFARIGTMVASGLRLMLEPYQLHGNCPRPVRYQGIDWRTKSLFGESAISTLNNVLKSVPTIVVEAQLEGDVISHYLGCWDAMEQFRYQKVFSIAWKDILYPLARQYASEWGKIRLRKLDSQYAHLSPEELQKCFIKDGDDDEINFQKLEEENENKRHGERVGHDYKYYVNDEKYVKEIAKFLNICHCFIVGFAVDNYYLFNYNESPIFPQLISELLREVDKNLQEKLLAAITSNYKSLFELLKKHPVAEKIPEFSLSLAQGLVDFDDKSFSKDAIDYSIESFLRLKRISKPEQEKFWEKLECIFNCVDDEDYVYNLKNYFKSIGDTKKSAKIETLLDTWHQKKLNREITRDKNGPTLYGLFC